MLEQFQLLPRCVRLMRSSAIKELNVVELPISNTQNTNLTILGERVFHPFDMHFRILHASTMPQVDGELKHDEPISLQKVTKVYISFLILLRFCWKVEKYQYPHNTIFIKSAKVRHKRITFQDNSHGAARPKNIYRAKPWSAARLSSADFVYH